MALTRGVHPDLLAAFGGVFSPIVLVYVDWPEVPIRACTALSNVTWAGHTWHAVGSFGEITVPQEGTNALVGASAELAWTGTVAELIAAMGVDVTGRRVGIWAGATTIPRGNVLIGDPVSMFQGTINSDEMPVARNGEELSVRLAYQIRAGIRARGSARPTHTYEDQIAKYPGDTAGRHMQNMAKYLSNPPSWPAR